MADRDRNLLFGVLAVQLRKVTPTQLVDIAGAWATDPSRSLGERLLEAGVLSPEDKSLLDGLVTQAITSFDGDASRTLEAFGGEEEVYHSFRGSVAMTDSGGIKSVAVTKHDEMAAKEPEELGDIPAVEEMPSRYTYINEYGRGGMGRVLLVHDEILGRDLALKELLPHLAQDGQDNKLTPVRMAMPLIARFLQEARITGQLEHPSIVPVYELGHRKDGTLYYTMKLVRGKTLHKAIHECKYLEERLKLLPHFVDLCNAIAYAHKHGVIHRDIKPMNVMIGEFGETVVLDWGLAKIKNKKDIHADAMQETIKALNLGDDMPSGKTRYGDILGTPVYMPPEQAKGDLNAIDERSDIYSLGAVLYEILTGNPPFGAQNVMQTIYQVINETPKSVVSQERRCPPDLIRFCNGAMEKQPEKRYQKAKELADAVEGSKLRPPKSRIKKYLQHAAIFLIVFIPCCTVGLNIKSERDLKNIKDKYAKLGIDTSGVLFSETRNKEENNIVKSNIITALDPLGALYGLELRFPGYAERLQNQMREIDWEIIRNKIPSKEESEKFRSLVEDNAVILNEVHEIADMPLSILSLEVQQSLTHDKTFGTMNIPNLLGLRNCANLLSAEALLYFQQGNSKKAVQCCCDILRLSSHLHEYPSLITSMFSVALNGISSQTFHTLLLHGSSLAEIPTESKEIIKMSIQRSSLKKSLQGELGSVIRLFAAIKDSPISLSNYLTSASGAEQKKIAWNEYFITFLYGSWPLRFWYNTDQIALIDIMGINILYSEQPYPEHTVILHSLTEKINNLFYAICHPITQLSLPNLWRSRIQSSEGVVLLSFLLLDVSIKEYHRDNNAYPPSLNALVPSYIDIEPMDPFPNEAFGYQQDESGYTIYSAGPDGKIDYCKVRPNDISMRHSERDLPLRGALEQYRKRNGGELPDSFQALVPEYMPDIPVEPISGQPYSFRCDGEKIHIGTLDSEGNLVPLNYSDDLYWAGK